ncbi:MAG: repeat-containing protein [Pedosphaera sp.]|nr:repeat-containing protein [Pedosphaera sp.]
MENQHRAIHACEVLGVNAKPAIPALIALFNNGYTHHSSTDDIGDALSRIGPESITPLIGSLTNRDEMVRANVANYLGEWPTESPVVVPILVKCLEDKSRAVRNMAARSLGELAREPTIAIPGLVGVLDDEEKFVRYNACLAIGQFKTQAPFATAPLLKSLNDFDPEVRNMAAISLAIIDPENVSTVEKAMPFLIESLKGIQVFDPRDYRWRLKSSAIEALGKCGKPAAAAVPTLVKCLESKEPGIGKAAEKSLKAIDPEALAKAGVK